MSDEVKPNLILRGSVEFATTYDSLTRRGSLEIPFKIREREGLHWLQKPEMEGDKIKNFEERIAQTRCIRLPVDRQVPILRGDKIDVHCNYPNAQNGAEILYVDVVHFLNGENKISARYFSSEYFPEAFCPF